MTNWSGGVAIVGAYEHPSRSMPQTHPFQLHADVILHVLDDAGLQLSDVDGFATAAADLATEGGTMMSAVEVAEWLGIRPSYLDSTDTGGAASLSHVGHAANAIASGQAEVVVVSYAATSRSTFLQAPGDGAALAFGPAQFELPYGPTLVGTYALAAQRHMSEFGTTPEHLAEIAVTCRYHASHNPQARYRDPLSIDDVLTSPMIASPLRRNDCCVVTDGAGALVLTSAACARSCRKAPVFVLGFGEAGGHVQMSQMPHFTTTPGVESSRRAFAQAGMRPEHIDTAQVYDSFTITALMLLEDIGFCPKGDGGAFVSDGRIRIGGDLPINTDGGGLSSNHPGRRGMFTIIESVRQLRREPVGLQVEGCEVSLAHGSGGSLSTAATLVLSK